MIASLLLVLAQSQAPAHAALHPESADVYLELGELPALWKAYEGAPLARLLRDEKVGGFLRGLGLQLEASPAKLFEGLLASEFPASGVDAWFDGLEKASLSLGASTASDAPTWTLTAIADFAEPAQCEVAKQALFALASAHAPLEGQSALGAERLTLDQPKLELWCRSDERRLILGGGATTPADVQARKDGAQGFAGDPSLQRAQSAFAKASGATIFWYAQRRSPLELLSALFPGDPQLASARQALAKVPAGDLLSGERALRMQLAGDRFVTEIFSSEPDKDAKHVLGNQPIQGAWLEPIPSKTMFAYASALDGAALANMLKGLLAKDEASSAALAALEKKLGFGVERIFGRLGPGLTVYSDAPAGPGLPEVRVWIDCSDPDAFQADLEQFVTAFGETMPGFTLRTRGYRVSNEATGAKIEIPVTTLTLPQEMAQLGPMSPSPSYARVGNKLVLALSSSNVKSELKRIHGGEGEPIVAGENIFVKRKVALPEDARSVVMMDWGSLIASALNMLKTLGPMLGDQLPFDLASLPQAYDVTQFFQPTYHYSRKVEGGTYRRNEGSFGPETWLGIAGVARQNVGQRARPQTVALEGSNPVGDPVAGRAQTERALEAMTQGLARYSSEFERYPADVTELTKPSAKFPDGFLPGNALPIDGWGRPLRYERTQDGHRLWSVGANGIDEGGAGDDVLPGSG